jgi:hypothetical protein
VSGSLSPVVHRGLAYRRRIIAPYVVGSALGGAGLGVALAGTSAALDAVAGTAVQGRVVAAVIVVYALGELVGRPVPRPNTKRQVPEGFRRTPYISTTAFLFAADLGMGWTTQQRSPAFLVFCLVAITVEPPLALAAGVAFGLARGMTLASGWRLRTVEQLADRYRPLYSRERAMTLATSAVAMTASVLLII